MTDIVISVENLGKKYRIRHQAERQGYVALRDVIANRFKSLFAKRSTLNAQRSTSIEEFWALKDVSFEVRRGEVVGIIGRNGAGKSTLLKILSRITEPTEGRVRLRGRVGSLLEVGTGFHPELTGRENVFLNGAILGMTRAEIKKKFDEIVAFAEVEKFLDTPVKRYSSGMYMRLAFSVAAHLEPEILVIDEVLAVGDAEFQNKCLGKMRDVASHGRTVLFVSHNLATVQSLCTRAHLLSCGRTTCSGDVEPVLRRYMKLVAAASYDIDLTQHPGRVGHLKPVLHHLRVLDDRSELLTSIPLGGPATFEITISPEVPLYSAMLAIHIHNPLGERITTYHTNWQARWSLTIKGPSVLRCRDPFVRLAPGQYAIVLALVANGQTMDRIDPAATIDVTPQDVYGTGKLPPHGQGVYLPSSEWTIGCPEAARLPNGVPSVEC